jgi:Ca-activated chloride channel family protein
VSFAAPLVLLGLLIVPALVWFYVRAQHRRARVAQAFVSPVLSASVLPQRPGWRRHAPMLALTVAIIVLIAAAARPQRTVAVPVDSAAIMLANDVSSSMSATDVKPSRLGAARAAAKRFVDGVPASVQVGQIEFARQPTLLQSPTTDHALTEQAIAQLRPGGGGTAIGEAIELGLHVLTGLRQHGKRPPGAIVLLSDGTSNVGTSPIVAAQQAKADHIEIDTISLGTASGTIPIRRGSQTVNAPVPVNPTELAQIAAQSGGKFYRAADDAKAQAVYAHLATRLGHKRVKRELTASFAGAGLGLLLITSAVSLFWFARLA